jgi:hypothetical protein
VLRHLGGGEPIPVMGGDARTGVAVRLTIDPRALVETQNAELRTQN